MIKLKEMFKNEKLKGFSKKVFTKKKIAAAIIALFLITGLKIGYSLIFEVNGTVLKVGTNSITVTNFLGTKTVNTGNYPIDSNRIIVGEKIEISKNLSGDVISIRTDNRNHNRDGQFAIGQNGKVQNGQAKQMGQDRHNGALQNGQSQNDGQGKNVQTSDGLTNQNGQSNQNGNSGQENADGVSSASVGK